MLVLRRTWPTTLWGLRRWLDRLMSDCPLWKLFLGSLVLFLSLFPALLLLIHQAVLHRWIWEKGMLDSWSLSYTLVYGDSQLSVGAATASTMLIKAHRCGLMLWPATARHPLSVITLYLLTGVWVSRWIFTINGRPDNLATDHRYAWIYDMSHLVLATLVTVVLIYAGLAMAGWLWRRQAAPWMWRYALVLVLIVVGYFAVATADRPAIRFQTGIEVSLPQAWELKLFGERMDGENWSRETGNQSNSIEDVQLLGPP